MKTPDRKDFGYSYIEGTLKPTPRHEIITGHCSYTGKRIYVILQKVLGQTDICRGSCSSCDGGDCGED